MWTVRGGFSEKVVSITKGSIVGHFEYVRPIACSKDGSSVLLDNGMNNMFWFDLRSKRAKRVNVPDVLKSFEAQMIVESLVPCDGHKKKKKKPKKNRYIYSCIAGQYIEYMLFIAL